MLLSFCWQVMSTASATAEVGCSWMLLEYVAVPSLQLSPPRHRCRTPSMPPLLPSLLLRLIPLVPPPSPLVFLPQSHVLQPLVKEILLLRLWQAQAL